MKLQHDDEDNKMPCGKFTSRENELLRRIKIPEPKVCDLCGKKFHSKTYLKQHIKVVHEGQEWAKNFICEFCSKAFISNSQLKKHVSFHHLKDPSHKCDICGKLFSQKSGIYTHMRSVHKLEQKQYVLKKHLIT